jgi:hypothetical protein
VNKNHFKKFSVICALTIAWLVTVMKGIFVGFPEDQASNAWTFLTASMTPFITGLWVWWFKIDIDEKKVLNGKQ